MNIHEETLKIARNLIKKDPSLTDWVISKFPELKESEDEMMIKFIKQQLFNIKKTITENYELDAKLTKAIDWLEKQGEPSIKWNKNTEGNKPQVNHSVLMKTTHGIAEGEWQGEQWYQYRWSSSVKDSDVLSWIELSDLEKKGEQKPFDYECADKSKEQSLSFQIQAYLNTASDELFAKGKPLYSEERLEEIHKCMLMWQTLHNAYFYRKPAWSEKDESHCQMLQKIICDSSASASLANKLSDWLKSLRPQKQWKPSEEQMDALADALSLAKNCGEGSAFDLRTLHEQLKKL